MSFAELGIIALVALIVLGPERLPAVARNLGKVFQKVRSFSDEITSEFNEQSKQDELERNVAKAEQADAEYQKQE